MRNLRDYFSHYGMTQKLPVLASAVGALLVLGASSASHAAVTPPDGFTALYSGTDLSGWWGADTE
ncbi:MAG: hypothetical protein ACREIC_18225, partial [Limisphaerales bacterium]